MNVRKWAIFISGAAGAVMMSHAGAADLVLQKVPPLTVEQAPRYPQNLARPEFGATVESGGKPAKGDLRLPVGVSTVLISLAQIEQIESIGFSNPGAAGKFMIATSSAKLPADSPQWHPFPTQSLSENATTAKVGPTEAKYVRLVFVLEKPGKLASLGVYGAAAVSDFTMPRSRGQGEIAAVDNNLTDLHAKARALYASSGDDLNAAQNLIDDQASTSFAFAADDRAPAVIIDLGRSVPVRRIAALVQTPGAHADFYVFDTLPNATTENAPDTLRLGDDIFSHWKPVASADDDGSGHFAAEFPEKTGRYLMVRWSGIEGSAFRVTEISAFGRSNGETLLAANARKADGKTMLPVGEAKDFSKEGKDIPAEGPEEAQPPGEGPGPELPAPPPFVFIPEIFPASP